MAENQKTLSADSILSQNSIKPVDDGKIKLSDHGFTILQIETMLACNMRCKYCAYPLTKSKGGKLTSEEIQQVIDLVDPDDENFDYLCFNQLNEPLLDDRIFELIKYAKERNLKVKVPTNALLFKSKDTRAKLIDAEPTYIKIALQTLDADKFSYVRGVKVPFQEFTEGIFEFLSDCRKKQSSSKITIDVACNFLTAKSLRTRGLLGLECGDPSVPNTIDSISEDFMTMLKNLHKYDPVFTYDDSTAREYLNNVNANYLKQQELTIAPNVSIKIKQFMYGRRLDEFYPAFKTPKCGTRILTVLANGSVVPCCIAYDDLLSMGNIKNDSLPNILERNADFIESIQKTGNLPNTCKKCKGAPTRRGALIVSLKRLLTQTG